MIKKETVISMECDCCGALMTESDGFTISLPDDNICRNILVRVAEKSGWKRNKEHWICPSCLEEGAEEPCHRFIWRKKEGGVDGQ